MWGERFNRCQDFLELQSGKRLRALIAWLDEAEGRERIVEGYPIPMESLAVCKICLFFEQKPLNGCVFPRHQLENRHSNSGFALAPSDLQWIPL
jgi:hypothetical protein